ncbi:MAG TPA: sugar transferase [Actinomycetes bacterium]|jgi:lipopolysaccharide/colanic/teichoic acid biosynthesis glycosyltransferase|nr:sugar transferase [Actinomycetes bacterium]
MLSLDREAWLVQADSEAPEALAIALPRAPLRTVSPAGMADGRRFRLRGSHLVVTGEALREERTADALAELAISGMRLLRPRDYYERTRRRVMLEELDESWFLFDRPLRRRPVYAAVKALVDVLAGLAGSSLAVLLIPVVWLVYRFGRPEDRGPVFYVQERIGLRGKPFRMVKFRTMRVDAEADGPAWARVDDDRVTRFGRLLRSTHLDELAQFFNVLRREMSVIGPRPERPVFVQLLGRAIPHFDRRHLVRPGVTGWAVVRFGYSDSIRDKWIIHEHDLYYIKHRSVLLDLEIAARTVLVMLTRRGQ